MNMRFILPVLALNKIDLVLFCVMLTINLECGSSLPSVGSNLFVIRSNPLETPLRDVMLGSLSFAVTMLFLVVLLARNPKIATWLRS